ncbi:MAG: lysophospholipid acyltransferase family protein [Mariprofundaceae bacterium]|nr:lysophospholipid acyltransferase family protein [Mariprofundaceae bacterium]
MKIKFLGWFIPPLIWLAHMLLRHTVRWKFVGNVYQPGQQQRFMLSMWHSRTLMMPLGFKEWNGRMLISEHRDGAYIADAVALLGIIAVRGSSTRGGARAALQMLHTAQRENRDLGVTPDGPKGPAEVLKPGLVRLAMKAAYPVLPVSYASKRHLRVRSWDRFYIPLPFTDGVFVYGDYVHPQEGESLNDFSQRVQQAMDETNQRAENYFNTPT